MLYLINFHGMTALFPWFAELRGFSTLFAHLIFGVVAALLIRQLSHPRSGHRLGVLIGYLLIASRAANSAYVHRSRCLLFFVDRSAVSFIR